MVLIALVQSTRAHVLRTSWSLMKPFPINIETTPSVYNSLYYTKSRRNDQKDGFLFYGVYYIQLNVIISKQSTNVTVATYCTFFLYMNDLRTKPSHKCDFPALKMFSQHTNRFIQSYY